MKFSNLLTVATAALMADSAIASWGISGANSGLDQQSGARPFRHPIEELQQSGPQWDLYIQALDFWQSTDQENMFSWYGIAGIHGLPNIPWDGADGGAYYVGYCTHGSVLFPTWHRPYLALYEQVLSIFAHQIADTYPDDQKATYQAAADQLRIPYWDWSVSAKMPDILQQQQVTVNAAWGSYTLNNPLYRYNYHPYDSDAMDGIYSNVNYTVRAPNDQAQSQPDVSNQQLSDNAQQLHDGMYQLFASQPTYNLFASTGADNGGQGYQNIENLHNIIHNSIGGSMAYLWIAAMDPVFWLHHANVDRLFAIWQAIYPDYTIAPQNNQLGTYVIPPNTMEDSNTPLKPFSSDDKSTFFTSDNVRSTKSFGYAYKEVVDWNVSKAQLQKNAKKAVNQIYNPNGSGAANKKRSMRHKRDQSSVDQKSANAASYQYVLNVVVDKSKVPSSMQIQFMLKNQTFATIPVTLGGTPNHPASSFATPGLQKGQVALTHALLSEGADLSNTNATLAQIAKEMSWVGQTPSGDKVQPSDLTGGTVKIQVSTRTVKQTSPEDEFPIYGDWAKLAESELGKFANSIIGSAADAIKSTIQGTLDDVL